MGKPLAATTTRLLDLCSTPKLAKRQALPSSNRVRIDPPLTLKMEKSSAGSDGLNQRGRTPLSAVVSDCVKRWFHDTLKEAKAGDISMMVLVGQMYHSGYGVSQNPKKAQAWIGKASRCRSSAMRVGHKPPGYGASDTESDALSDDQE